MSNRKSWLRHLMAGALLAGFTNAALAQAPATVPMTQPSAPAAAGHPLDPGLKIAYESLKSIKENVKDYTCTLVKRERVDGKLSEPEYMFTKVRHEPFSVYMYFLKPDDVAGREVIYVHGANNGSLLAHEAKGAARLLGTVELNPTSAVAMRGNRYPITEVGVLNLTRRLVDVAENDRQFGECNVQMTPAKMNGRQCTMMHVEHPVPRKNFLFNVARIFMDDELKLPIRYEAYDWPEKAGGAPVLTEEYTYANLKINDNLTDEDFNPKNQKYNFKR